MIVGYARVSTRDQTARLQRDALKAAGCERIFEDQGASGSKWTQKDRPQLHACLKALKPGDVLTVWKLDRLGRSLPHLIQTLEGVKERGIEFRSLTQQIDTTTPEGRLQYHIIAAFAEFERSVTVERIRAGLAAAKRRGSRLGRKHKLDYQQIKHAQTLIEAGESVTKIARTLKVARQTVYSGLQKFSRAA